MRQSIFAAAFCHGRIGQIRFDGVRQCAPVTGWHKAARILNDHFRISPGITGNDGCFRGHGFKRRQAKAFIAGRRDVKREPAIPDAHVRHFAQNKNTVLQTGCRNPGAQLGFKGLIFGGCAPRDNGRPVRIFRQERDHRINEKVRSF
ncbi:Uncharacterised protein [Brucella abortus]|nr:Uncharacterised protein [Brucella abortus]